MTRAALTACLIALAGCTTLPNLQSFFGPTPQQRCAAQKEDWRAVITYQSDGSGSWRIECYKAAPVASKDGVILGDYNYPVANSPLVVRPLASSDLPKASSPP